MLTLNIKEKESFNDKTNEFEHYNACSLCLEHSLVSLSKWESKWHKSFLNTEKKTNEELIDYIKCMTLTQNVDPRIYSILSIDNINEINSYISNPMTATTFQENIPEGAKTNKKEIITSEVIYFWMVSYQIPFECQKWHLNRLLTLIKICSIKNSNGKDDKRSKKSVLSSYKALNMARKQALHSRG